MTDGAASLARRLRFAGDAGAFLYWLFSRKPFSRLAAVGHWPAARFPSRAARLLYDFFESLRVAKVVPDFGNVELALLNVAGRVQQHPRYYSYWHDPALHSMVGMIVGVDLIRHRGRYYVIENNHGPSLYPRRRALYTTPFDPLISALLSNAKELGFESVILIGYRWTPGWVDEFRRAGEAYGLHAEAVNCPFDQPDETRHYVALPKPLAGKTMYVVHSGLTSAVTAYIDNKWYTAEWLRAALEHELPPDTPVALPDTRETFFVPAEDPGPRWPTLTVKLAAGARSRAVIAARFRDEAEGRALFGLGADGIVPRQLRGEFAKSLLFAGRDRVIYQQFVEPELDDRGHVRLIRLHLFVSPLSRMYLSAHYRLSRGPVPVSVPPGVIGQDDAFIFNQADYQPLTPAIEDELKVVADHLGGAMQRAIARKFETAPPDNARRQFDAPTPNNSPGSTSAIR